jgi:hypothetical protein
MNYKLDADRRNKLFHLNRKNFFVFEKSNKKFIRFYKNMSKQTLIQK